MYLNQQQTNNIRKLIRNFERNTGVELMTAVVGKCDAYPEIPWKAFALAAALNAAATVVYGFNAPAWPAAWTTLMLVSWVLGTGAAAALLTTLWTAFARLFLDGERAESEARQYAQGLFLEHGCHRMDVHRTVLLLIGLFERQVVILQDRGVAERLSAECLDGIIGQMLPHLRHRDNYQALAQGIAGIEAALLASGVDATDDARNLIPDGVIQERGDQP